MSQTGTGGWTEKEKRLMGVEMLRQEVQAKDISWAESLSGAPRGLSNRAAKSVQT